MNRFIIMVLIFAALVGLGGCTIGNWNICGPQTPQAYCDKKAYNELVNPTPPRDRWVKEDAGPDALALDWQACGGERDGGIGLNRVSVSGKEAADLSREKFYSVQRCMMGKSYKYAGTCEGDIPSRYPACQARSR